MAISVLGFILYMVVGDVDNAEYLLVPFQGRCRQLGGAAYCSSAAIIGYLRRRRPGRTGRTVRRGLAMLARPIGLFIGMSSWWSGNPAIIFVEAAAAVRQGHRAEARNRADPGVPAGACSIRSGFRFDHVRQEACIGRMRRCCCASC